MNYEEASTGIENDYRAMSDGSELVDEYEAENVEKEWDFHCAVDIINEFKSIVKNEEEYADLITANAKIIEIQEIYIQNEINPSEELLIEMKSLKQDVINIAQQKLKPQYDSIPLSEKKLITVKDFENLYSIKEEAQRKLRKRDRDPLPFVQIIEGGNVLYDVKKIDKWIENYYKERN